MLYTTFLLHWPFGKYLSLWFIRHIFFSFGRINGVSVDSLVGDEKTTLAAKSLTIESILEYAVFLWNPFTDLTLQRLEMVQTRTTRCVCGALDELLQCQRCWKVYNGQHLKIDTRGHVLNFFTVFIIIST